MLTRRRPAGRTPESAQRHLPSQTLGFARRPGRLRWGPWPPVSGAAGGQALGSEPGEVPGHVMLQDTQYTPVSSMHNSGVVTSDSKHQISIK